MPSRQWALLKEEKSEKFNEQNPEWLHKENFECAFTAGMHPRAFNTCSSVCGHGSELSAVLMRSVLIAFICNLWDRRSAGSSGLFF